MAAGASASQSILTNAGWRTLGQLHNIYVYNGLAGITIAYAEPTKFREVHYMPVHQLYDESIRMGVRLTTEDGITALVCADGAILDMAEDYPPRPTIRVPSDAKCLVGPNLDTDTKYFVRKIVKREFVTINCYTLPVPNMIGKGGFVIIA